ncbi:MAG: hemerythrin domain-containing protein [Candidatus Thermoplasmatota archaeon]|nr:hemerythrin domain-containing protein [Candidatus Thermoplasmatota archaeon]
MTFRNSLSFKGSNATQLLRDQHAVTVDVSEGFLENSRDIDEFLSHVDYTIKVHFVLEDNILNPAFRPYLRQYMEFEEPIRIITGEHISVRNLYSGINKPITFEGGESIHLTQEEIIGKGGHIAKILLQHVYKEENGLFGLIEQYLPQPKKDEVARELSARFVELDSAYKSDVNHKH